MRELAALKPGREDRSRAFPGTLKSFSPDPGQVRSRLLNKDLELSYSLRSEERAGRRAGGAKTDAGNFEEPTMRILQRAGRDN